MELGPSRISLGTFSRKIIYRVLATRLANLLPRLVDEEQAGFVKWRNIATNITLAQELLRDINRNVTGETWFSRLIWRKLMIDWNGGSFFAL